MNIDEKLRVIKDKISSDLATSLTEEENFILDENISSFFNNENDILNFINNYNKKYNQIRNINFFKLGFQYLSVNYYNYVISLDKQKYKDYFINTCLCGLLEKETLFAIEEIAESIELNFLYLKDDLINEYYETISREDYKIKYVAGDVSFDYAVNTLLNLKKYKDLKEITPPKYQFNSQLKLIISDEVLNRLINEYPFNELGYPSLLLFNSNIPKELANKISFKDFINWFDENYKNINNKNYYIELFINQIEKMEYIDYIPFELEKFLLNTNYASKINNLFQDRGYYIDYKNNMPKILDIAEKQDNYKIKYFNIKELDEEFRQRYINLLIKKGLYIERIINDIDSKIIIENIIKNTNFKDFNKVVKLSYSNDVIETLFNKNEVEKICIDTDITIDKLLLIKKYLIKHPKTIIKCFPPVNILYDKELFDILLQNENYELIIEYVDLNYEKEEALYYVMKNVYMANLFLYRNKYELFKKNKVNILKKLLSDDYFVPKLLDIINHNETLSDYYNTLFDDFAKYYSKKYNITIEKMNLIKNKLGAEVLKYIDNENVRKIINLDDDNLEKLFNLIIIDNYDINILKSAYESLVQYLFPKKNQDDVEIFSNFVHAIYDKDYKKIELLKVKIVCLIDEKIFADLKNKKNLQFDNINDALNEIINDLLNNINREDNLIILNTITTKYIELKRQNYLKNYFFEEKYPIYKDLFDNFYESALNKNQTKLEELYDIIIPLLDNNFYKEFNKKYNLNVSNIEILRLISNNIDNEKYIEILSFITKYVHDLQVSKISKKCTLEEELALPYVYEEKSLCNSYKKYLLANSDKINIDEQSLKSILVNEGADEKLLDMYSLYFEYIYNINTNLSKKYTETEINELKKNINTLMKIINKVYNKYIDKIGLGKIEFTDFPKICYYEISKKYEVKNEKIDYYQLLMDLNIDFIKDLFCNETNYNKLKDIFNKRNPYIAINNLKSLISNSEFTDNISDLAYFINYFEQIYEDKKEELKIRNLDLSNVELSLTDILKYTTVYSATSSVYSRILGKEDAKLIQTNPGPNSAFKNTNKIDRLNRAVELTINNYKRQVITIPTFTEDISSNNKTINVIVGNFTDSRTITHGERTGACMRIGGAGETLFNFCLENENGFHIVFEDPETHEYISRVSGFRNGNSVFLNQLRESLNEDKYSNQDLINFSKVIAKKLIEYSSDSSYRIDNVFITKDYALKKSRENLIELNTDDIKEGLPKFYSDINKKAVVLATTDKIDEYAPINFSKLNIPKYKPLRAKIREIEGPTSLTYINRVVGIKELLKNIPIEELSEPIINDIKYAYVSDDWYVYINEKGEIYSDYIDIDSRAKIELDEYTDLLKNKFKENSYGK